MCVAPFAKFSYSGYVVFGAVGKREFEKTLGMVVSRVIANAMHSTCDIRKYDVEPGRQYSEIKRVIERNAYNFGIGQHIRFQKHECTIVRRATCSDVAG